MKNLFNSVKMTKLPRNAFDLSHDVKLSCNMGQLVPICVLETVPGDKFDISCESLLRFAPLVAPMMHRVDVTMHYFFVPNRLTYAEWENFIVGRVDPVTGLQPDAPWIVVTPADWAASPLYDYLGIPPVSAGGTGVNALPFAAYQAVYNEYYRDQNLIPSIDYQLQPGNNVALHGALRTMRRRAWEHDYFTSALPTAQAGTAVDIPLGEVILNPDWDADGNSPSFQHPSGAGSNVDGTVQQIGSPGASQVVVDTGAADVAAAYNPDGSLETAPTTINDLRRAFRLQEWLEKSIRGGTRYIEFIKSMFGVRSSDARLQRPEYITGIKTPVQISEVLNTTGTTELPQGNMAGHGVAVTSGKYGHYYCEEHGYIIGVMSVIPKTAYQQGIPKHFLKIGDQFDYYFKDFANIGEQPVINLEVYAEHATPGGVFGYVPRYAEYKFVNNRVAGDFRDTLDHWHMGRVFSAAPALNQAFVECTPTTRVFAVEDAAVDKLYVHVLNKIRAIRPMPKYGTPQF